VAGFAKGALASGTAGDHPDIAYSWYVNWLEWLRDTGHTSSARWWPSARSSSGSA
jgi:hypothetical protein